MNIKRFHAPTAREALAKARMAFGDGTLILSNRPTPNGVEVVATAEESLNALDEAASPPMQERPVAKSAPRESNNVRAASNPVHQDTETLAMSTLSFQDYVRERMLRRRHEALGEAETLQAERPARYHVAWPVHPRDDAEHPHHQCHRPTDGPRPRPPQQRSEPQPERSVRQRVPARE